MIPSFYHLFYRVKTKHTVSSPLPPLLIMLFFITLFDGLLGYSLPILIVENGISKTMLGIIIGTSSVAGGLFDFALSYVIRETRFRRLYLFMFVAATAYLIFLGMADTPLLFVLAMVCWGIYYDLMNFGNFDFVARKTDREDHTNSFGFIDIVRSTGYMLAPLIASIFILDTVSPLLFTLASIILAFAFIVYLFFSSMRFKNSDTPREPHRVHMTFLHEIHIWKKLGHILLPVLVTLFFLNVAESFFWTIGPLLSEELKVLNPFGGLFISMYYLPPLVAGWVVGEVARKRGKKYTAVISLLISSIALFLFPLTHNAFVILTLVLVVSFCFAFAFPSIRGAIADYVGESRKYEPELEGVTDFSANIGYVVGPIMAGILADQTGNLTAFGILGSIGIVLSLFLLPFSTRHITIPKKM